MNRLFFVILCFCIINGVKAQTSMPKEDTTWKTIYRASATRINDLVHTKLEAKFDYDKSYMYGKVWITLHPHFYSTDSLMLDAKGMEIKQVAIVDNNGSLKDLKYDYSNQVTLQIQLDKVYKKDEKYTIFIQYTAKPNDFKTKNSQTDNIGLHFINPKGEDKNKPIQIWTQGETEATSVWCPTIDNPNQKTTDEIYMTVPDQYVTLSNGLLVNQQKNNDGTRTDYWKMDLPHAPYLFFMGVGNYEIIKDNYKDKEVNYYVEKEYASVARNIFGKTPEMIKCFSNLTGVDFAWPKYAQIVCRGYGGGAMENTTATLHSDQANQNARQLIDENKWEDVVSHELFHHWFGDLVTTESWSNLTVNESFANYGEVLWREYKYGKESADEHRYQDLQQYLVSKSENKDLVRFYYKDKEEMFDQVSYPKGGCILNMLRNTIGDSAFFKSLNLYLNTNKFKTAEAHQLRLAFEEITGQDLNWFFNQWYYGNGHPKLDISYSYDNVKQMIDVHIKQTQESKKLFRLPIAIDVYSNNHEVKRYNVVIDKLDQTFTFPGLSDYNYNLINVDADKYLVCEKEDHKTTANFIYQYLHGKNYIDRIEALNYFNTHLSEPVVRNLLIQTVKDSHYLLRIRTLNLFQKIEHLTPNEEKIIYTIAQKDPSRLVRASAIDVLATLDKKTYQPFFIKATSDSSYNVAGAALEALIYVDKEIVKKIADQLKNDAKDRLQETMRIVEIINKSDDDFNTIAGAYEKGNLQEKFEQTSSFIYYLSIVKNTEKLKKGVDMIVSFRESVLPFYPPVKKIINKEFKLLIKLKTKLQKGIANEEQIKYINSKM